MFYANMSDKYQKIHLEGCEPSETSYSYFVDTYGSTIPVKAHPTDFLNVETSHRFDVVVAVYVLPHILFEDLREVAQKIHRTLNKGGRFYTVVTSETSFKADKNDKDLFNIVEHNTLQYENGVYEEFLHKSFLPEIGYVLDYNRDEKLYIDLFLSNGFVLDKKQELDDGYFLNSLLVFQKQ